MSRTRHRHVEPRKYKRPKPAKLRPQKSDKQRRSNDRVQLKKEWN